MDIKNIPIWLEDALLEMARGIKETIGASCTERISDYLKSVGMPSDDEIGWCAAFVEFVLGIHYHGGTGKAYARSYLTWGETLTEPCLGCVVVYRRGTVAENKARVKAGQPELGHVNFYLDSHNGYVYGIGGNQGDRVGVSRYPVGDVLGYRIPKGMVI